MRKTDLTRHRYRGFTLLNFGGGRFGYLDHVQEKHVMPYEYKGVMAAFAAMRELVDSGKATKENYAED